MQNAHVPLLGFVACSGTGKTSLLTKLIPLLKQHGLKLGLIKHAHHDFDIDYPGKDSYRLREAGASPVMVISSKRRAVITEIFPEKEPDLDGQLRFLDQSELDLVLVEGFKHARFPKIEVHRPVLQNPLLYPEDPYIIAVASDGMLHLPASMPMLDLNRPDRIAEFVIKNVIVH